MKVVFLADTYSRPSEPGILRTWLLTRHLCDAGDHVTVIAPRTHYLFGTVLATELELPPNLTLRLLPAVRLRRERVWSRVRNYACQMVGGAILAWRAGPCDVVVASLSPSMLGAGAYLVARARRTAFVLDERDLSLDAAAQYGVIPHSVLTVAGLVERQIHLRADGISAATPGLERMLKERGINASRISLIPNGFVDNLQPCLVDRQTRRCSLGWKDRAVALYAGGLGIAYDLDVVLDALHLLRGSDVTLVVLGEGERKAHYRLRAEREQLPVQFLDPVPKDEVHAICEAADFCLLPLRAVPWSKCSLSNKLFDYLGAGRPVIVTGPGDNADIVGATGAGYVVPAGESARMADAMRMLAEASEGRRSAMGQKGRASLVADWPQDRFSGAFRQSLTRAISESRKVATREREQELDRIRRVYSSYSRSARQQAKRRCVSPSWLASRAGRWQAIEGVLSVIPAKDRPSVLDVGCGGGTDLQRIANLWESLRPELYGVDLLPERIQAARRQLPSAHLFAQSADSLPFPDDYFDVILASTLFSSILDRRLAKALAREMMRTLAKDGVLVCYDLRFPSLANPNVRAVRRRKLEALFADAHITVRPLTLLPPLARRLKRAGAHDVLARLPFLRSHSLAVITHAR